MDYNPAHLVPLLILGWLLGRYSELSSRMLTAAILLIVAYRYLP